MKLIEAIAQSKKERLFVSLAARPGTTGMKFYDAMFKHHNFNAEYVACESTDIGADLELARGKVDGISITMPFKTQLVPYIDKWTDSRLTVANTIRSRASEFVAHNCDLKALETLLPLTVFEKDVIILGDGAMAENVKLACPRANSITQYSRKLGNWDDRHNATGDVLINTTSIGMTAGEMPINSVANFDLVIDCVIGNTELIKTAKALGKDTIPGSKIYVEQFKHQFKIYTGITPDETKLEQVRQQVFNDI